jgi:hypothetical protein
MILSRGMKGNAVYICQVRSFFYFLLYILVMAPTMFMKCTVESLDGIKYLSS